MKDVEEGSGELVVTGGDGTADLEVADHALDTVALAVDASVPSNDGLARRFWRDDVANAVGFQLGADGIGVVALVRQEIDGLYVDERDDFFERGTVRRFAGREVEGEWETPGITETMNFTGEPAPRPSKSLFASPPFAPAAET
jgi:hypothetical protein